MTHEEKKQVRNEKGAISYLLVLQDNEKEGKGNVSLGDFMKKWEEFFPMRYKNPYMNMDLNAEAIKATRETTYRMLHEQFKDKSSEDVLAYRNKLLIVKDRHIPEDLAQQAKEKRLKIVLNKNIDRCLSGYNIFYKGACITNRPYQLTEEEIRKIISEFPSSKEELVNQENSLLDLLHDESANRKTKLEAIRNFKTIYVTHDFQVRINRYLFKYCTDKSLALATIGLCSRTGIVNLQNYKPIMLRYCKAADTKTRKCVKHTKAKRRKNTKSSKGKGR